MKLYVPEIGDSITLDKDWTFEVYKERRNSSLIQRIFGNTNQPSHYVDCWPMNLSVDINYDNHQKNYNFSGDGKNFIYLVDLIYRNKNINDPGQSALYSCLYSIYGYPLSPWSIANNHTIRKAIVTQNSIINPIINNVKIDYSTINYNKSCNYINKLQINNIKVIDKLELTLPKDTVLKVDRIYIRKGSSDFSSISFIIETCPVQELTDTKKLPKNFLGYKPEKPKVRFWAKLSDCNNMEII